MFGSWSDSSEKAGDWLDANYIGVRSDRKFSQVVIRHEKVITGLDWNDVASER